MIIRKLLKLFFARFNQFTVIKAEARTPKARHAFKISIAAIVININTLAAFNHQRAKFLEAVQRRVRMNDTFHVAGLHIAWGRIECHGVTSKKTNIRQRVSGFGFRQVFLVRKAQLTGEV